MNGFRPGHEPAQPTRQKQLVQIIVLGNSERGGWPCPPLGMTIINATHDARFRWKVEFLLDLRPFDFARNSAVALARKNSADFLVMCDNDVSCRMALADALAEMPSDVSVLGLNYAIGQNIPRLAGLGEHEIRGNFVEVDSIGGGCLILRSEIWRKIPGPWFKWVTKNDELLTPDVSEDVYFCQLARQHGFRIWSHRLPAAHMRCVDLTEELARLQAGGVR